MKSIKREPSHLLTVPAKTIARHVKPALKAHNISYPRDADDDYFLTNGGRFYQDVSDRWEYATPEDSSFLGTTANEFASEQILQELAESYTEQHKGQRISLTKRAIDDAAIGCGYHVSFCGDARHLSIDEKALGLFGKFAATRGVVFGSGALLPQSKFIIAQKAATVTMDYSSGTTGDRKPVVNLRKEHLANEEKFVRVHDTSCDPSMSPWSNRTKIGAGSLVIRLIEHGITLPEVEFADSLTTVSHKVANDLTLKVRLKLIGGGSVTALDVQRSIIKKIHKLSKEITLSSEEEWTLEEWDRAISDLRQNPNLALKRVEWVARRKILERYINKHGVSWDSAELRYKDIQFSEIALPGIAKSLRETLWSEYMPDQSLIDNRVRNPPATTRAHARVGFIKFALRRCRPLGVDWDTVQIGDKYHYLSDPYDFSHPGLVELHDRS